VKAEIEMQHLNLSDSTLGQYRHSWMDIRQYFIENDTINYDEGLLQRFIHNIDLQRNDGVIKEWKWKINRKAAHVLMEVIKTGCFQWGIVNRSVCCIGIETESLRLQYLTSLKQRNLSETTISLYDYVFRKTLAFAEVEKQEDLLSLSPGKVQLVIRKFAYVCNKRSMATILPILRSLLKFFHATALTQTDLSGIVMGCFMQRNSVAAYISEKDQTDLLVQLDNESKRTKAVILLAMRLGLRDCDICNLTFQEIDWRNDKIRLIQIKTGEPLVLPLLPDVGNALMDYILNERPKRDDYYAYIFLRKQAPYNKLASVYTICSNLLRRQQINPVNGTAMGVHLFRYTMVHRLLAAKVPHQVITDVLGHVSKESDKPYLSMDESMLRMCTLDLSVIDKISWKEDA
jgi:integrase